MVIFLMLLGLALLIVYINKTNALSRKVMELESVLEQLKLAAKPAQKDEASVPALEPAAVKIEDSSIPPLSLEKDKGKEWTNLFSLKLAAQTREEWEALIGGKLLNRIGAVALIIGVGFFLKYSFDNNWITEWMRVIIGFVIGSALLFYGMRSHKRGYKIFAQGLVGAGISTLYLSVYASFNFYHLMPQVAALALMSAVTIIAFLQAFYYNSLAITILGWAGGFLTPVLLSTGQANEVGLFIYIALLDAGLLMILTRKPSWTILEPLTLSATYIIYLAWFLKFHVPDQVFPTVMFVSVFWGLFYALHLFYILKSGDTFSRVSQAVAVFNVIFYYAALYTIIEPHYHQWMGLVTLASGLTYFLPLLLLKQRMAGNVGLFSQHIMTSIVFLVIATKIQFEGLKTPLFWSLEAVMLAYFGIRWKLSNVWRPALALFGLAVLMLVSTKGAFHYFPINEYTFMLNQRALTFIVLAVSLGASAVLFKQLDDKYSKNIQEWLQYSWCIVLLALCTIETNDCFQRLLLDADSNAAQSLVFKDYLTLSLVWLAYSLPLAWYGLRKQILPVLHSGLATMALSIFMTVVAGISYTPLENFTVLLNYRLAVLLLIITGTIVHAHWLKNARQVYDWLEKAIAVLRVCTILLGLVLLSGETWDYYKKAIISLEQSGITVEIAGRLNHLKNLQQLSLSLIWLLYSIFLMVLGIWRRVRELRLASIVLFGITILKIFIYDLSFLETLYRIFSFIGLGLILLGVSYLYQRYRAIIFSGSSKEYENRL